MSSHLRAAAEPEAARACPHCGKRLARLNPGPTCFACQGHVPEPAGRPRARRARLPHDEIIALYREVGDTTRVATRLGLARSSVWYVVERAKRDGRLPA
jgi:hypothetical protein